MVVAYHLIWTAYGWWLPNDPRGSSSHEIRVASLAQLGELHHGRKKVQPSSAELRRFFEDAERLLTHPLLTFDADAVACLAEAFAATLQERRYTCYACAIMPDHIHFLIRRHRDKSEAMIEALQNDSREALIASEFHPATHPVWGGKGWSVYLESRDDIERVIAYIRNNPLELGWEVEEWSFVQPYDGWMPAYAFRKGKRRET